MNQQRACNHEFHSSVAASAASGIFSNILYAYYYIHMAILSVLALPHIMAAAAQIAWFKWSMLIASLVMFIYCIYRLIKNEQMAIRCMNRMPEWFHNGMDRLPAWTRHLMNHNAMRIMMIGMDLMLAWMCAEFVFTVLNQFGW